MIGIALVAQIAVPASGDSAWMWLSGVLAVAIGALFVKYDLAKDKRIARSEQREDALIADNRSMAATLRDQVAATLKAADVAGQAVEYAKRSDQNLEEMRRQLDGVKRTLDDIRSDKR